MSTTHRAIVIKWLRHSHAALMVWICPLLNAQSRYVNPTPAGELARHSELLANAVAFAKASNLSSAEQVLVQLNRGRADSASWHVQTAQRLVLLAGELTRQRRADVASEVGARALQALVRANDAARNDKERSAVKTVAGYIYERLVGDRDAAAAAYRTASQLDPSAKHALERAERIERTLEHERRLKDRK